MTYKHICKCQLPACICPNNWALCKYCEAEITWVKTQLGRSMPIDGHLKTFEFDSAHHRAHQQTCEFPPERKPRPTKPKTQAKLKPRAPVNPKQSNIFAELVLSELNALRTNKPGG